MKRENVFLNLDLSDLSAQPGALHIDNKIILIDNLDDVADEENANSLSFANYPMKLSFTIGLIVLSGGMKVKINLEDFEARAGDAIVVFKGNIGGYWWLAHFSHFYHSQNIDIQRHCKTLYRDTNP